MHLQHYKEPINFPESFAYGWEMTKKHWFLLLQIAVLSFIIMFPLNLMETLMQKFMSFLKFSEVLTFFLFEIVVWSISVTLLYNTTRIYLHLLHGKKTVASDLFNLPNKKTIEFFVTNVIYFLLVFCGLVLFIVPGIYFALKYYFATTIVVDKNVSILQAGAKSAELMQGEKWQMFAYLLILVLCCFFICIIGFMFLVVGVIPAAFLATNLFYFSNLWVYKSLSK